MFERFFQWAMKHGTRILMAFVVIVLSLAVARGVDEVAVAYKKFAMTDAGRVWVGLSHFYAWYLILTQVLTGAVFASWPLLGAAFIHRVDHWLRKGGTTVAVGTSTPAPSRLFGFVARLSTGLACLQFIAGVLHLVYLGVFFQDYILETRLDVLQNSFAPVWSGAMTLFAGGLVLDRLNRWLATLKTADASAM